ncbi:MAG: AbrB/MazE/SpoVT family DNA-binding domain-containing protein [Prolixibacteraceae bacterium]|nr:AbrB/MazE/SpoVT family DNA-binding domain-containing protein [Burkholderiales bacterium]
MESIVAERGQITLPKAVRDAFGLTKGSRLEVNVSGGRIILRKKVEDTISRGRFGDGGDAKAPMRKLRGRAPGDPLSDDRGRFFYVARHSGQLGPR